MIVAVVHDRAAGTPDELDGQAETEAVGGWLRALGHTVRTLTVAMGPGEARALCSSLDDLQPEVVFNLVEGSGADPRNQASLAAVLQADGWTITGSGFAALLCTTDKRVSRSLLRQQGLPVPDGIAWASPDPPGDLPLPWILKPAWQDASVGIDDAAVIRDPADLAAAWRSRKDSGQPWLLETFLEGREFNVSLLARADGTLEVLPPAELVFDLWPEDKPRLIGYAAKWQTESFEYQHTVRRFVEEPDLRAELERLARACWEVFDLNGYARVDVRQDRAGRLCILEVNANPGIGPDAGFMAAAGRAGYEAPEVIRRVLANALRPWPAAQEVPA